MPDNTPTPAPAPTTVPTANPQAPAAASTGIPQPQSAVQQVIGLAQTAAAIAGTVDPKAAVAIALVSGLIDLIQQALPAIDQMVSSGAVSPAQAQAIRDKWSAFADTGDSLFDQPQWQIQK